MSDWIAVAERVYDAEGRYVGECPYGDLWVPSRTRANWWDRRLDLRRPTHWLYWLRSRLAKRIAWLDD